MSNFSSPLMAKIPLDIRKSMDAKVVASKQKANKERARKAGNLGRKTTRCASGKACRGGSGTKGTK